MRHPLDFIPVSSRKPIFFTALALTLIVFAIFRVLDAPLRTLAAPNGIVSFELAGSPANTQAMIDSWDARARLFAAFGLGFDYLFMPTYVLALALGILLAAGRHQGGFKLVGAVAGWGVFAAAVFDALENLGLTISLLNGVSAPWPQVSAFSATLKFTLLLAGLAFAVLGGVWPKQK
jgi:hypothetical protein